MCTECFVELYGLLPTTSTSSQVDFPSFLFDIVPGVIWVELHFPLRGALFCWSHADITFKASEYPLHGWFPPPWPQLKGNEFSEAPPALPCWKSPPCFGVPESYLKVLLDNDGKVSGLGGLRETRLWARPCSSLQRAWLLFFQGCVSASCLLVIEHPRIHNLAD